MRNAQNLSYVRRPLGIVSVPWILGVGVLLSGASLALLGALSGQRSASVPEAVVPADGPEIAAAMVRLGLDADALCAVGATPAGVTTAVARADAYLLENIGDYREAAQAFDSASRSVSRLERQARAGGGEAVAQQLATARQSLASATTSLTAIQDELFTAATQGMTEAQRTALRNIHANKRVHGAIPVEYLVTTRSEGEWVRLRDSLAHVRVCEQRGVGPDPEPVAFIATCNAVPATVTARTNIALNRTSCGSAFMEAVLGGP